MIDPRQLAALEQQHGLPQGLLSAVQQAESGGNPNAVSPKGALGAFQFMPATAQQYGIDPLDPQQAAVGAARMYGDLAKKYNGDIPSMLAAYNWGSGNLQKKGLQNAPQETRDYISKIQAKLGGQQYAQADTGNMTDAIVSNAPPPPEGFDLPEPPAGFDSEVPPPPSGFDLTEAPKSKPDFWDRAGADIEKRGKQGWEAINAYKAGKQSLPETALQVFGKSGFGTVGDIAGEGLVSGFKALPDVLTDPFVKTGKMIAGALPETGAAEAIGSGLRGYDEIAQKYPRAARNLEAVGDIATGLPIGKGLKAAVSEGVSPLLVQTGSALEKSAAKSVESAKSNFVKDLILPKQTPSVKEDLVGRTKEVGWNRRKEVILTPQEQEIADTVSAIPEVKKSNSLQGNANAIQQANRKEAENLIENLKKNDVPIESDVIANGLSGIRDKLAKNPYLSGVDASKAADSVVNQAMEIIQKNPRTASGLLQSRKDLDAWVKSQKPNIFDAADSPVSTAVREVRQGINDIVDASVPDAAVKDSLRRQSNLYRAHEAIASKAKDEASTRLGRAVQSVGKGVSLKQGIAGTAALAGLGATGLAAPAAGGALAIYGAKKAITSPALRKGIGKTLSTTGKIIK